jgi:hypothetical protein
MSLHLFGRPQTKLTFVSSAFFAALGVSLMSSPGLFEMWFGGSRADVRRGKFVEQRLSVPVPVPFEQRWGAPSEKGVGGPGFSDELADLRQLSDARSARLEAIQKSEDERRDAPTKLTKKDTHRKSVPVPRDRPLSAPSRPQPYVASPPKMIDTPSSQVVMPPVVAASPASESAKRAAIGRGTALVTESPAASVNWPMVQWITSALAILVSFLIGVFGRDLRRWIGRTSSSGVPEKPMPFDVR